METAWLIERDDGGSLEYVAIVQGVMCWTPQHLDALRFARQQDAQAFATYYHPGPLVRVHLHRWG